MTTAGGSSSLARLPLVLIGLLFGKSLLSHVLGEAMSLDDAGWRALTLRWGLFFLFLAALNEIVWRSFSTATWVSVKSFGFIPLTIVFAASQVPLMLRHKAQPKVGAPNIPVADTSSR